MKKKALITGISGQTGSYLADFLVQKGYEVHGVVRRSSTLTRGRIDHLRSADPAHSPLVLHYGDLNDLTSLRRTIHRLAPEEIYHLAGQSHVGLSFDIAEATCRENAMATLGLLEIVRDMNRPAKLYHASSSEIFGAPVTSPQDEHTPFNPVNPYGCAKAFATQMCRIFRQSYGLFVCSGITYNHESPRRGENFVTRKISLAAARIKLGMQDRLLLGDLSSRRDWGYAKEYVEPMWAMLQQPSPEDFILATGESHSVAEFVEEAFKVVSLNWKDYVSFDSRHTRVSESTLLVGNPGKAGKLLGWYPKVRFLELARLMVTSDLNSLNPDGLNNE